MKLLVLLALTLLACASPAPSSPTAATAAPAAGAAIRYFVGGDSRDDTAHVLPWAFKEARARGLQAVIFLGDMEHTAELDDHFKAELAALGPIPFYPVLGNHETVRHPYGTPPPHDETARAFEVFRGRFLGTTRTPVASTFPDKLAYAVDLPGGVHFVALDNVSQLGFGADQMTWLSADLAKARADARTRHIVVGMHKALAGSGVTQHAMEEDGPTSLADSAAALALFEQRGVELVFASHYHGFAEYQTHRIRCIITGGLGAPLDDDHGRAGMFHHFLELDVLPDAPLAVQVVRFEGTPAPPRQHAQ
jgi:3',5'-cyclic AMP phosphodiesterase CpdA